MFPLTVNTVALSYLGQQYAEQHASHDAVVVQKPNEHSIRAPSDVDNMLNAQALQSIRVRVQQAVPLPVELNTCGNSKFREADFVCLPISLNPLSLTKTSSLILPSVVKLFPISINNSIFF